MMEQFFLLRIDIKGEGVKLFGMSGRHGAPTRRELIPYLNAHLGFEYEILSIDEIDKDRFENLSKLDWKES